MKNLYNNFRNDCILSAWKRLIRLEFESAIVSIIPKWLYGMWMMPIMLTASAELDSYRKNCKMDSSHWVYFPFGYSDS